MSGSPFDRRETATILAALRYWQKDLEANEGEVIDSMFFEEETPLTVEEIDDLCEMVNTL